jgi:transketolase
LLGDGECAEGSVWEAANLAGIYHLNNLIALVDVNRLGQSQPTPFGHDLDVYRRRFEAFNWRTEVIDGHDMEEIVEVLAAAGLGNQPLAIIAKTVKGKGISFVEDKEGWHGKPLNQEEAARAVAELQPKARSGHEVPIAAPLAVGPMDQQPPQTYPPLAYKSGEMVATREAYGNALVRIGEVDARIVVLDGDTKNSTYSEKFFKKFPERSFECHHHPVRSRYVIHPLAPIGHRHLGAIALSLALAPGRTSGSPPPRRSASYAPILPRRWFTAIPAPARSALMC